MGCDGRAVATVGGLDLRLLPNPEYLRFESESHTIMKRKLTEEMEAKVGNFGRNRIRTPNTNTPWM